MTSGPQDIESAILRAAAALDAWQEVMVAVARALPGSRTRLLGYDGTLLRAFPKAAGRRGVSVHTVRDRVKAAMLKAETRRRSAVVRLVPQMRRGR